MAFGGPGPAGLPAVSHVEQEQDLAQEAAAVLDLLVVEEVALDQALQRKTVTHDVAQVKKLILTIPGYL